MDEDPREHELSMDELDLVTGGGAIAPVAQSAGQVAREFILGRQGVVDDSV